MGKLGLRCGWPGFGTGGASHIPEGRSESGRYSREVDKMRAQGRAPLQALIKTEWGFETASSVCPYE